MPEAIAEITESWIDGSGVHIRLKVEGHGETEIIANGPNFSIKKKKSRKAAKKRRRPRKKIASTNPRTQFSSTLNELGFVDYNAYLNSPLWSTIRSRVLRNNHHKCGMCGKLASQVHHRSYDKTVMAGQDDSKLTPICRPCHNSIEFTNGKKNGLKTANKKLKAGTGDAAQHTKVTTVPPRATRNTISGSLQQAQNRATG